MKVEIYVTSSTLYALGRQPPGLSRDELDSNMEVFA